MSHQPQRNAVVACPTNHPRDPTVVCRGCVSHQPLTRSHSSMPWLRVLTNHQRDPTVVCRGCASHQPSTRDPTSMNAQGIENFLVIRITRIKIVQSNSIWLCFLWQLLGQVEICQGIIQVIGIWLKINST